MAKERFENRVLSGVTINVACKYDDGTVRYWNEKKEVIVARIVAIVKEYSRQGYVLTLRQLHYQLVTRNWIVNHDTAYKKLGSILDDCRYAGVIDWNAIEDRGRRPYIPYSADDLADGLDDLRNQYRINRQEGQNTYVELWTEKDALSGILRRSTEKYHIQLVVNKGYTSSSAIYNAYERIVDKIKSGKQVKILYFGDHDPSGLDMVRDIKDRLTFFLTRGDKLGWKTDYYDNLINEWWKEKEYSLYGMVERELVSLRDAKSMLESDGNDELDKKFDAAKIAWYLDEHQLFQIVPIGLTMEQIKQYNLPSNPAKLTDSRAGNYVRQFGKISWEVDALEPTVLTSIVEEHIQEYLDIDLYNEVCAKEKKDVERIGELMEIEIERQKGQ